MINPTTNQRQTGSMVAHAHECAPPGVMVRGVNAPFGAQYISTPPILRLAHEAVNAMADDLEATDAVVIGSIADPGRDALTARFSSGVVGLGEAAMDEAASTGRFSIITACPHLIQDITSLAHAYGHAEALVSVRAIVGDTARHLDNVAALLPAIRRVMDSILKENVGAVIIGGPMIGTLASTLAREVPMHVVDPIAAAIAKVSGGIDIAAKGRLSHRPAGAWPARPTSDEGT
nr:aspartate/glutamate racemase family protein [Acuticoccus kalidii]